MINKDKDLNENEVAAELVAERFGTQSEPLASPPVGLAQLGLNQVAYIRRSVVNDVHTWTIHSASGVPLGSAENLDQAWVAVMQHGLEPLHVH